MLPCTMCYNGVINTYKQTYTYVHKYTCTYVHMYICICTHTEHIQLMLVHVTYILPTREWRYLYGFKICKHVYKNISEIMSFTVHTHVYNSIHNFYVSAKSC